MRILAIILSVVLAFGFMPEAGAQLKLVSKEKLKSVNSPKLSRDSASLDFVTRHIVAETMSEDDAPVRFSYEFRNAGRTKLEIKRLVSTCSCAQAICTRKIVAPGEKAEIIVTYNPKGHPGKFERKVFVYTMDGDTPAAVLKLSVSVEHSMDIADQYPISMGKIRLKTTAVRFRKGNETVLGIKFINVSGKPLRFDCDRAFLPECLGFYAPPTRPLEEAEMTIGYHPSRAEAKEKMTIFLNELGVPPSQSSLTVYIDESE